MQVLPRVCRRGNSCEKYSASTVHEEHSGNNTKASGADVQRIFFIQLSSQWMGSCTSFLNSRWFEKVGNLRYRGDVFGETECKLD